MRNTYYSLYFAATPGSVVNYVDPVTGTDGVYTVPASGRVHFYIGQTTLPLEARASKHVGHAIRLEDYLNGRYEGQYVRNYALYTFMVEQGLTDREAVYAQPLAIGSIEKDCQEEKRLIQYYRDRGYPLQNLMLTPAHGRVTHPQYPHLQ